MESFTQSVDTLSRDSSGVSYDTEWMAFYVLISCAVKNILIQSVPIKAYQILARRSGSSWTDMSYSWSVSIDE